MYGAMTVTVLHPVDGVTDTHGVPLQAFASETVEGVSVRPEQTVTLIDAETHQHAIEITLALAFPKHYEGDLRGAFVEVPIYPGRRWAIQGDPLPTPDAPTAWNRNARAVLADG